jgi:hypothetical protein
MADKLVEECVAKTKDVLKPDELLEFKTELRHSLVSMFTALTNEVNDLIKEAGYNSDDYVVCVYPFSFESIDKSPIPDNLLNHIKRGLEKGLVRNKVKKRKNKTSTLS